MAKTLQEYADWLDGRDLIWPRPPELEAPKATPFAKPLPGIRAVSWSVYGTLLRITDGRLLFRPEKQIRMQVALEKTIQEFNMWQSMYRKAGAPWEEMLRQYDDLLSEGRMVAVKKKGDFPEVNSAKLWRKLIGRLEQKQYSYDVSLYGDFDELSEKVAYFFHASLQGVEPSPHALKTLLAISQTKIRQGLLADGQPFTLVQLLRGLKEQGTLPPLGQLFAPGCLTLSSQEGFCKPSRSLYETCLQRFAELDIEPGEVLHVGSRLKDDLAVAKQFGMKTALYAGDKLSLEASSSEVRDPAMKPDRLVTDVSQVRNILAAG